MSKLKDAYKIRQRAQALAGSEPERALGMFQAAGYMFRDLGNEPEARTDFLVAAEVAERLGQDDHATTLTKLAVKSIDDD